MPKSQSKRAQNLSPAIEARLQKLLSDQTTVILKATDQKIDGVKKAMEELLADQANLILEAVGETLEKKLDEKFDPVITKLDGIMKGVEALQQENVVGAEQLRRHTGRNVETIPTVEQYDPAGQQDTPR